MRRSELNINQDFLFRYLDNGWVELKELDSNRYRSYYINTSGRVLVFPRGCFVSARLHNGTLKTILRDGIDNEYIIDEDGNKLEFIPRETRSNNIDQKTPSKAPVTNSLWQLLK